MSRLRKLFIDLHLYAGLAITLTIVVISATGCILTFEREIDHAINPNYFKIPPGTSEVPLSTMMDAARRAEPNGRLIVMTLPKERERPHMFGFSTGRQFFVNRHNGQVIAVRDQRARTFLGLILNLHRTLTFGKAGRQIVGWSTVFQIFLIVTGLIIWWPRKIFTVHPAYRWKRINFDLHNVAGIFSFLVVLFIALTGILMTFGQTTRPWLFKLTGPPKQQARLPKVKPQPGVKTLETDQILKIASDIDPESQTTVVIFPQDKDPLVRVSKSAPGSIRNTEQLLLNKYTGKLEAAQRMALTDPGSIALRSIVPIHTGDIYGWPTRIIVFLSTLAIVVQAVSGFIIWFNRQRAKWRKARRLKQQEPLVAEMA